MRMLLLCCLTLVTVAFAQPPGEIVVYYANSTNTYVQDALNNLGWSFTGYDDNQETAFQVDVANGADIVVYSTPSNYDPASLGVLDTYVNGGGRLIMSFWAMSFELGSSLWATLELTYLSEYTAPLPFYGWETSHNVFNVPNVITFPLTFRDEWVRDGQRIDVVSAGFMLGGYTASAQAGQGGMVLGNDGATIYNGFCIDEGNNIVPLIENELIYVWENVALERNTWGSIKSAF